MTETSNRRQWSTPPPCHVGALSACSLTPYTRYGMDYRSTMDVDQRANRTVCCSCCRLLPFVPLAAAGCFLRLVAVSSSPLRYLSSEQPKHETKGFHGCESTVHSRGGDAVVPTAGDPAGVRLLRNLRRHLVCGMHPRGTEVNASTDSQDREASYYDGGETILG